MKNVIVFLLVLFATPVWCFADIKDESCKGERI